MQNRPTGMLEYECAGIFASGQLAEDAWLRKLKMSAGIKRVDPNMPVPVELGLSIDDIGLSTCTNKVRRNLPSMYGATGAVRKKKAWIRKQEMNVWAMLIKSVYAGVRNLHIQTREGKRGKGGVKKEKKKEEREQE